MSSFLIKPAFSIKGEIHLPADKSISHRAIIISSISNGKTTIKNFSFSQDCYYTIQAFKKLGIRIIRKGKTLIVYGRGLRGLKASARPIFVGDSGTTLRLLLGVLSGQKFSTTLSAGRSLTLRPMKRVTQPLRMMGAQINSKFNPPSPKGFGGLSVETLVKADKILSSKPLDEYPPITIKGGNISAITYKLPVASAQVKSAILLAGLYAKGTTKVIEPIPTRDHTERMLKLFAADLRVKGQKININQTKELISPSCITIRGDISCASFFIVAALIIKNSSLIIRSVNLNPRRIGLIKVLKRMGGDIKVATQEPRAESQEPAGNLLVKSSLLRGTTVKKQEVPSLIDELPILMVAACCAQAETIIESIEELRIKETDRVNSMVKGLRKMGTKIQVKRQNNKENIIITGVKHLIGAKVSSFSDHRTAMSLIIAGLKAKGNSLIDDVTCINKSFPGFLATLKGIIQSFDYA